MLTEVCLFGRFGVSVFIVVVVVVVAVAVWMSGLWSGLPFVGRQLVGQSLKM